MTSPDDQEARTARVMAAQYRTGYGMLRALVMIMLDNQVPVQWARHKLREADRVVGLTEQDFKHADR